MKVLWVSNSPIGPAAKLLGEEYAGSSGGWIQSEYEQLDKSNIEFSFLTTLPSISKGDTLHKTGIEGELYCIHAPKICYGVYADAILQKNIQEVIDKVKPDIIQIWGTETWISNAVSRCKTKAMKFIFIQGLIGVHKRYIGGYFGRLKEDQEYFKGVGLYSKLKKVYREHQFIKQAEIEAETIKNCGNVIIDSNFAAAYCKSIEKKVTCYWHSLKPNSVFYRYKWDYNKCNKNTIFTVYGSSSEKGTQNLLKALAIVKKYIPDTHLIIPGPYQTDNGGKLLPSKKDEFQMVIYNMIKRLGLIDNISFPGRLAPEGMASTMSKANVFVNPSCMEVHALSLREALTVGLPCISSLCGSVGEYLHHGENGYLYRYEEYEVLAYYLLKVLRNPEQAINLSSNSISNINTRKSQTLNSIYNLE